MNISTFSSIMRFQVTFEFKLEFEIYTNFDQFTLSFACLYISFKNEDASLLSALDYLITKFDIDKVLTS
jgi:hypothetical protein